MQPTSQDTLESPPSVDVLQAEVGKLGSECKWMEAVQLCTNFLKTADSKVKNLAFELQGDCLYYFSFQLKTRSEFKVAMLRAKDAFESACLDKDRDSSFVKRCSARAGFCRILATDDADERRKIILGECIAPLRAVSSEFLEEPAGQKHLARVGTEYLRYLLVGCHTTLDAGELARLVKETKVAGGRAFAREMDSDDVEGLVLVSNAYVLFLEWASGYFLDASEFREISEKIVPKTEQLIKRSRELADKHLASLGLETAASITNEFEMNFESGSSLLENALSIAEETGDSLLIGRQLSSIANAMLWLQQEEEAPEKKRELLNKCIGYASSAIETLKIPLVMFYLSFAYSLYVCSLTELARNEADIATKLKLLGKAIEIGKQGIESSKASSIDFLLIRLSDALRYRAELSENDDERRSLLSESILIIEEHLSRTKVLPSADFWNLGLGFRDAGKVYYDLSNSEVGEPRIAHLTKSIKAFETSVGMLEKSARAKGQETSIALTYEALGDSLLQMYELGHGKDYCVKAIDSYDHSVRTYEKMSADASVAHLAVYLLVKMAALYDRLAEYESSSICLNKATEACTAASKSESGTLQKSFQGLASFTSASSKVEEARLLHSHEKYSQAIAKLQDAYSELDKTEGYRYLAKHYLALSRAEEGEDHSRNERNLEAAEAFDKAANLFSQSQEEILQSIREMPGSVSENVKTWAELSDRRAKYCLGRKTLALAKSLDNEGQAEESLHRYQAAAKVFRDLKSGRGEDAQELEALAMSCDAWAVMKEAEHRSSPELYAKAAVEFMQAKDRKVKKSFVLSCLANAAICRALEAGTKFKQSRQIQLYSEIKQQLGVAAQFYEEAGFEIAAGWTSGTEALFDALAYLSAGESEMDPSKKTQMYHLAEKYLELAAKRYGDIGFEKKRQEVLKQLKKAKENKEMLLTPIEALSQNPTSYSTPVNFTAEHGVGIDRFDGSSLTGNISISANSVNVGTLVRVDVDIANVGRSPVLLMKLDNLAPESGFEPEREKETHHFLDSKDSIAIDLKGRRIEYLKTHEMNVHIRAKSKGTFELRPKVLFVDESGKYKSYEFEPMRVEVKELGIFGWAKGT